MTLEEYFGDWMTVIDKPYLLNIMRWLKTFDKGQIRPDYPSVFKAFRACSLSNCNVVMVGMDPYPQPGVATGILFGNSEDTPESKLSPSLKVVKEALPKMKEGETFDNTMVYWAKQGILMINSALTCQTNVVGSHVAVWRPFVANLLEGISLSRDGFVFILFGKQARSFKPFIRGHHEIIEMEHPAYFARKGEKMPGQFLLDMNEYLKLVGKPTINFYKNE